MINIPANTVNGETRMRIRNYFNPISDACSSANFGETEDYKVIISGGKEIEVINAKAENPTPSSIDLSWGVSTNGNPSGFILKQSTDGINFSTLTNLTSNERFYTASSLSNNTKYWFQIIESGTINSNPKTVWNTTLESSLSNNDYVLDKEFKIFPIPFENGTIKIKSKNTIHSIKVIDLLGKVVLDKVKPNKFGNIYSIENIPRGMYILKIESDKGDFSKTIISKY
ncbi:MAG: T9SS type A sorting domain-containing protein [Flavobacteriaceae bacterium]|nr:T9SS type A sorting domain-containing protein [Flavobacteriaceae bacterium]